VTTQTYVTNLRIQEEYSELKKKPMGQKLTKLGTPNKCCL